MPFEDGPCAYRSHVPNSTIYRAPTPQQNGPLRPCGKRHVARERNHQHPETRPDPVSTIQAEACNTQQAERPPSLYYQGEHFALMRRPGFEFPLFLLSPSFRRLLLPRTSLLPYFVPSMAH